MNVTDFVVTILNMFFDITRTEPLSWAVAIAMLCVCFRYAMALTHSKKGGQI